jgi:AbrB family looped-hinge helix DNA binding protein
MKITSKGQVTIPQEIRQQAGLLPDTEVEFELRKDGVFLRRVEEKQRRGAQLIARMRKLKPSIAMSTDEIMALTRDTKK